MNSMKFTHTSSLRGELTVPGDKSISHRSVMFGALADGLTEIHGFLQGADCLSTISCFSKMGISIENQGESVLGPRTWTARADCPRLRFRLRQQRHHNAPDLRHSLGPEI